MGSGIEVNGNKHTGRPLNRVILLIILKTKTTEKKKQNPGISRALELASMNAGKIPIGKACQACDMFS